MVRVIERWREVGGWWEQDDNRSVDRLVIRVELSDGAVADLAWAGARTGARTATGDSSSDNTKGGAGDAWRLVGLVD